MWLACRAGKAVYGLQAPGVRLVLWSVESGIANGVDAGVSVLYVFKTSPRNLAPDFLLPIALNN